MKIIMTGPKGNLAFLDTQGNGPRAFGFQGRFRRPATLDFAKARSLTANANTAPIGGEGAEPVDLALDLLYDISGGRDTGMMMY